MSKTIAAGRNRLNRLRAVSRGVLGPDAFDADVEVRRRRAYEGPDEPDVVLTPQEEEAWERQFAGDIAEADGAGGHGPAILIDSTELPRPTPRRLHSALADFERDA